MKLRRWAIGLGLLAAGCGSTPRVKESLPGPPLPALTLHQTAAGPRLVGAAVEGPLRWVPPDPAASLPQPPAGVQQIASADLTADGQPELVTAGPTGVTAWQPAGRRLWHFPLSGAQVLALSVADLTGSRPQVLLAGPPPVGLLALAADGKLAWRASGVRTAYALLPEPAASGEGSLWAALDTRTLQRFDALGQPLGQVGTKLPGREALLVVSSLARLGEQLLLAGWPTDQSPDRLTWALATADGQIEQVGDAGSVPPLGRVSLLVAPFRQPDEPLAAVIDGRGAVTWVGRGGAVASGPQVLLPPTAVCLGPPRGGRPTLAVADPQAVHLVGW
ncbi:MAG: hypothetical protein IT204_03625 [Fimbriimonadaceae bacterium]|nr:hypothetical protein [Fimbriimonadaceae bacterium]